MSKIPTRWQEGYDAFYREVDEELPLTENPYPEDSQDHKEWQAGYDTADACESGDWW